MSDKGFIWNTSNSDSGCNKLYDVGKCCWNNDVGNYEKY